MKVLILKNLEWDLDCITRICRMYPDTIKDHIVKEETLTYRYGLYCDDEFYRFAYKVWSVR